MASRTRRCGRVQRQKLHNLRISAAVVLGRRKRSKDQPYAVVLRLCPSVLKRMERGNKSQYVCGMGSVALQQTGIPGGTANRKAAQTRAATGEVRCAGPILRRASTREWREM